MSRHDASADKRSLSHSHDTLMTEEPLIRRNSSPTNPAVGAGAALAAAVCMSGYVLLSERSTNRHGDASGFLLLRQLGATACMLLLAASRTKRVWPGLPPKQSRGNIQLLGLFQFLNALLFVYGLSLAGSFVAAVCQLSIPVITFAFATFSGLERPSLRRAMAMLTIVGGCALTACGHAMHEAAAIAARDAAAAAAAASDGVVPVVISDPISTKMIFEGRRLFDALIIEGRALHATLTNSHYHSIRKRGHHSTKVLHASHLPLFGVLLLLCQCASFVGIVLVQRRVLKHHPVSIVVLWSYLIATLYTALYCLCVGSLWRLSSQITSTADAGSLAFAAVFGSVIYFEAVALATKHLPPTIVACSVALEPLAVSLLGALFFGHVTTPFEVGGYAVASIGACAMAGLVETDGSSGSSNSDSDTEAEGSVGGSGCASPLRSSSLELTPRQTTLSAQSWQDNSGPRSPRSRPNAGPLPPSLADSAC